MISALGLAIVLAPWEFHMRPDIPVAQAIRVVEREMPKILGLEDAPDWEFEVGTSTPFNDRVIRVENPELSVRVVPSVGGLAVGSAHPTHGRATPTIDEPADARNQDLVLQENLGVWTAEVLGRVNDTGDWVVVRHELRPSRLEPQPDGTKKRTPGSVTWTMAREPVGYRCHDGARSWAELALDPYDGSLLVYRCSETIHYSRAQASMTPERAMVAASAYAAKMGRNAPVRVATEVIPLGWALHPDEYQRRLQAWADYRAAEDVDTQRMAALRKQGKELSDEEEMDRLWELSQRFAAAIWPWPTAEAVLAYWFTADDLTIFVDAADGTAWHHMEPDGSTFIPDPPAPKMPPRADP